MLLCEKGTPSHLLAADNRHRAATGAELRSRLDKSIRSGRRCAVRSYENNYLLTRVAAVGDTFISFHIIPPVLSPVDLPEEEGVGAV